MALSSETHEPFYVTTGTGKDKASTDDITQATAAWADSKANGCERYLKDPVLAPLLYQLQQMQDEINYLRTEISTNKGKATFPGFGTSGSTALVGNTALLALGTSGSTALAGDTTTISTAQANEITASTSHNAKLNVAAAAGSTKSTAITFGEFTTTVAGKTTTYSLPVTVVETTVGKKGNTTLTKTGAITLT